MSNERALFRDGGSVVALRDRLQTQLERTLKLIAKATPDAVKSKVQEQDFVDQCTVDLIELAIDHGEVKWNEPDISVRDQPNIGGINAKLTIPFTGDRQILGAIPSHQPCEMPIGTVGDNLTHGEDDGYVRFGYSSSTIDAAEFNAWRDDREARLTQWLEVLNEDAKNFNKSVRPAIKAAIVARKAALKELAAFDEAIRR